MAKIISLGCEVADIHRRYSAINDALFGASSYRLVIHAMTGRMDATYRKYEHSLEELRTELSTLEGSILDAGKKERAPRAAEQLPQALIEYTRLLREVIDSLTVICQKLMEDDKGYREVSDAGGSPFSQDKIRYDYSIRQLERLGSRLNKLFSSY